jgi:hypothetical protein
MPPGEWRLRIDDILDAIARTHPMLERRIGALDTFNLSTKCPQNSVQQKEAAEAASFVKNFGGRQEARTPDLRVANAALSQLS